MPLDVILFLVIVAGFFVVGLPLITTRVWMPVRLEIEDVPEAELEDRQQLFFKELDGEMTDLGFSAARTYRVTNLQGFNLVRTYLSPVMPEVVHAFLLRSEINLGAPPSAMNYLEVSTGYGDDTTASTRNGELSSIFEEPPHHDLKVRRLLHRPAALIDAHQQRTEALQIREPRYIRADDLETHIAKHHDRWTRFQLDEGRLRLDTDGELLRPTIRTGLIGIRNFLNPFADNLTPGRLLTALVFGLGIPVAGVLLFGDSTSFPAYWLAEWVGLRPEIMRWAGLAVVFAVLGTVAGWLFESKAFIWTFLLAWVPLRLAGAVALPTFGLSLWAGALAAWAAKQRTRRRLLV